MKTIIKPMIFGIAVAVIMLACSNFSTSAQSDEAVKEINEHAFFADTVKPLSYMLYLKSKSMNSLFINSFITALLPEPIESLSAATKISGIGACY